MLSPAIRSRALAAASFLVLAAAAGAAQAQTAPADIPIANTDQPVSEVVVTATRDIDGVRRDLLGSSITVLSPQDVELRQTQVVSDILRDVPGIAVSRAGGPGGLTDVRIRGAESNHTLVLIDGIESSDAAAGQFDFGTLIADESARIEVLRGQQSALYGSDAIGGVINYITLTGAEAPGIRLRAEGGSFGTISGGARIAGIAGNLDYALSSSYLGTDGYPVAPGGRRDVGARSLVASGKTIWSPAPDLHLTAVLRYSRTRGGNSDTDQAFGSPTFGQLVDSPGVHFTNRTLQGLLRGQLDLLDGRWTHALTAQFTSNRRINYDVANPFSSPIAGQPIIPSYGTRGRRLKGSYETALRFGDDAVKHRLTFALDGERERARTTVSTFGAFTGARRTDNVGAVGEYELVANDRLAVGGALRHDWNSRFRDDTTWRAQASYKFAGSTRVRAAGGSGVKAPTFSELFDTFAGTYIGNPNLRPEKSIGWEAGIEQSLRDGRILIGATYFDNRLKDAITTVFAPVSFAATSINLPGRTRQRGVETFANLKLAGGWRIDASYTYLDAPQTRTVSTGVFDGQAIRRAKNIASLQIDWAPPQARFTAHAGVRYNGQQNDLDFATFPSTLVRLRSFALVELAGTYALTDRIELYGRVENQLGEDYQEQFGYATPGRAGYGGVRVKF